MGRWRVLGVGVRDLGGEDEELVVGMVVGALVFSSLKRVMRL